MIRQKGVDPAAADALHELARLGLRLLLATNATAAETRWSALQIVGVHELFAVGLVSYSLNVRKDEPLFYDLVVTAARCPAPEVLFVGDSIASDVVGPMRAGMQACLVRPGGLRPGERVLERALLIGHICELPAGGGSAMSWPRHQPEGRQRQAPRVSGAEERINGGNRFHNRRFCPVRGADDHPQPRGDRRGEPGDRHRHPAQRPRVGKDH